jgi:hypothetical protein
MNEITSIKSTIVSAFVSNVNMRDDRTLLKYFELGKQLITCNVPKIIFLDEDMYQHVVTNMDICNENTRIYKISKKDSYLYRFEKYLTNFLLNTDNANKDTIEFMFTMCNKTEWVKDAILLNDFNTNNFIWVDFGIRHIFQCSDEDFHLKINELKYKEYDNVRISSIWWNLEDYHFNEETDIYDKIMWFFAGGVFGGNKNALLVFSERMKEKCIEIILTKGTIMWEVNIWYLIYIECNDLFYRYWCSNHNETLIDHY